MPRIETLWAVSATSQGDVETVRRARPLAPHNRPLRPRKAPGRLDGRLGYCRTSDARSKSVVVPCDRLLQRCRSARFAMVQALKDFVTNAIR